MEDILSILPSEISVERYIGNVDVERLDGTILSDVELYRKEKYTDIHDIESIYGREYVAIKGNEEIFLGDDRGTNLLIKERDF